MRKRHHRVGLVFWWSSAFHPAPRDKPAGPGCKAQNDLTVNRLEMDICIIDKNLFMAQFLKLLLEGLGLSDQIRMYRSPSDFIGADLGKWVPDLIITPLFMDDMDGLVMVDKAKNILGHGLRFIAFDSRQGARKLRPALLLGASAYIKNGARHKSSLPKVVAAAKNAKVNVNGPMQDRLLSLMPFEEKPIYKLTPQERSVLKLICDGSTNKEIAHTMALSINTVKFYVTILLRKFRVKTSADMVSFVARNGA